MSKRRNENGQMRREEYEAENDRDGDSSGEGGLDGGFQRAPEAAIARRKIVTARVGGKKPTAAAASAVPAAPVAPPASKANAFAGFSGLASADPPARANPFAGFSGLATTAASSSSSSVAPKGKPTNYQEAIEVLNKDFLDFVSEQLKKNPSSDWTAAAQDYLKHAQEIGTKFASTKPVAGSVAASARASARPLSTPAVESVPSFLNASKKDESPVASGFSFGAKKDLPVPVSAPAATPSNGFSFGANSASPKPAVSGGFSFGSSAASTSDAAKEKEPTKPASSLFSFSSKPAEEKSIPAFSFGAAPKPAENGDKPKPSGSFSFGAAPAAAPASSGGFSFGAAPTTTPAAASSGFSFSLSAPAAPSTSGAPFAFGASSSSSAPAASSAAAEAEEDEENIGREEATVILKSDNPDENCLFDVEKAKVLEFKKDEKRWADKGTHPLKVLINKSTKNARILVRNEIGKIVLNSALYKGLAIKPHEAKGKKTGALLALQVDASITQFILKVNTEKVDAFLTALEDATPK